MPIETRQSKRRRTSVTESSDSVTQRLSAAGSSLPPSPAARSRSSYFGAAYEAAFRARLRGQTHPTTGAQAAATTPAQAAARNILSARTRNAAPAALTSRRRGRNRGAVAAMAASQKYPYEDLGDCSCICEFCGASFWFAERVKSSPLNEPPRYNMCCRGGRVKLPFPKQPPPELKALFQNRSFLLNIRRYNSMFAMTSFGADVDDSINKGGGPYVFKVVGQVSHVLGTLCPIGPKQPKFLQLYIYDTANEVSNRMSFFNENGRNKLKADVVSSLLRILDDHNVLVRLFRTARDICAADSPEFYIRLYHGDNRHPYETPTIGTLGAIIYDNDPASRDFDIIVHSRDGFPQRVSNLHTSYMSLQYPLLFPYGEPGWSPSLRIPSTSSDTDTRLSMNMFYSYQIHDRPGTYTVLLDAGRLLQQYLVDAYICIERNRLDYIQANQNSLRTEFLSGVHDAISRGDTEGHSVGKRVFLPSSFTGGPRYMYKHYQDALAICRVHGNPQYFITFTCNAKWPEITRHLTRNPLLTAQDIPQIVSRVFEMKVHSFMSFLKDSKPFGVVAADLYTIEFQKRGLPHCHTLLWVTEPYRVQTPQRVDEFICAEIPDRDADPVLYKVITESMIHGPCGLAREDSPCMHNGKCSKNYPRDYQMETRFDDDGRVHYRRRRNGPSVEKGGVLVDSRFVVPYNKMLCTRFEAHINVEHCGWSMMSKYLFKYISKGPDRVKYKVTSESTTAPEPATTLPGSVSAGASTSVPVQGIEIDEIHNFVDGRFVCPHEAAWRILNFRIHNRRPAVQALAVHLEGKQNVTFRDRTLLTDVVDNPLTAKSTLTEWLNSNRGDLTGRHLRYIDYLSEYTWKTSNKEWKRRLVNRAPAIGLVYVMALRTTVYQLTQHRQPFWLSVRVIHMWEALNDPPAMTCLLLDINGDAIQAVFKGTEAVHVRHKLKKMMSYDIYRYTLIAPPPFDKVAPIDIAIQIDRNLVAVPLEDNLQLPYKYFNFMARHHLNNWPILNRQLIDYMGKITDLEEAHIEENTTVLRVTLQAPGSRLIVVSLWNNIYEDLIIPNITEVDHEVIFIATALRVVPIPGSVRLQCTAGTRLFVDPGLPEKKEMAA
ncbi:hypothetical protein SSX86_001592 [Deinandra increscens subsp. villosa]|uniref:Helitron helicase-like domain-containing protein n=1 Tax=Deinandra increscens subsp. villosa TaxID=3103831 RepID=A0AAP0HCS1_9ASTR